MGMGASNVDARLASSLGCLDDFVKPDFQPALDIPNGGVLFALPALLAVGLLKTTGDFFKLPKGYYGLSSLFLLLAFMALSRLKFIESLRYSSPGEWGNLIGLDRVPEVRTLRIKLKQLSANDAPEQWSADLCQQWMQAAPEEAATLYIDGHVRVYNGYQTKLPRHHVARQKLCLRATCDYWVNAMDGQPFLVVHQAVDPGMISVIESDILPIMERDVPNQPTESELQEDRYLHRFTMVFDREGYSPDFLLRLKKLRVACMTYHKYPGDNWAIDEFQVCTVKMNNGKVEKLMLAERGSRLSNRLWVREVRKLTERGHQTSVLTTDYKTHHSTVAVRMFARWSQENYFKYARENFNLDRLVDYRTDVITDPIQVVNPDHRRVDGQVRSSVGKLHRLQAKFGALNFEEEIEPKKVELFIERKAIMREDIELLQKETLELKSTRKETPRHISVLELPEEERFKQLSTPSKHLVDTIKMIAYRAETAMANLLCELIEPETVEVRSLLRAIYQSEADILPDEKAGTLTVRLHHMANRSFDTVIRKFCDSLNETETLFPETNLRLILKLGST